MGQVSVAHESGNALLTISSGSVRLTVTLDPAQAGRVAAELAGPGARGNAIMVWEFADAPEVFRRLSGHGGDEDFIALLPPGVAHLPDWFTTWRDVKRVTFPDGSVLLIAAHA